MYGRVPGVRPVRLTSEFIRRAQSRGEWPGASRTFLLGFVDRFERDGDDAIPVSDPFGSEERLDEKFFSVEERTSICVFP